MNAQERQLADWWCRLNCFDVPAELQKVGFAATGEWGLELRRTDRQKGFLSGAMAAIEAAIGRDKCLERWNDPRRIHVEYLNESPPPAARGDATCP